MAKRTRAVSGWFRLSAKLLLVVAALLLSRRAAFACARSVGWADAALTRRGRYLRGQFRRTHGTAQQHARESLAYEYIDLVGQVRILMGREVLTDAEVSRVTAGLPEATAASFAAGQPLMVALGHFGKASSFKLLASAAAMMRARAVPGVLTVVRLGEDPRLDWRLRLIDRFFRALEDRLLLQINRRFGRVETVEIGKRNVAATRRLLNELRRDGSVVAIHMDTPWDGPSGHTRPFAGWGHATFSSGAIALARSAGCPVVVAVPSRFDRPGWHAEVSEPLDPAGPAPDAGTLDRVLDAIERHVGERPADYRLRPQAAGWSRRWDARAKNWAAAQTDA